jgi:hypothetical protein
MNMAGLAHAVAYDKLDDEGLVELLPKPAMGVRAEGSCQATLARSAGARC